jgi:hypothetical protein
MNTKKLIIILSVVLVTLIVLGFLLDLYLKNLAKKTREEDTKKITAVTESYVKAYGTYDATGSQTEYLNSFLGYLADGYKINVQDSLNNMNLDKGTINYEKSIHLKLSTEINKLEITSQENYLAEVNVEIKKKTTSTEKSENSEVTQSQIINLVKQGNDWLVSNVTTDSTNIPDTFTPQAIDNTISD